MIALQQQPQVATSFKPLSKLLGMAIHDKYRIVRVVNSTANVTDGHIIIRRKAA